MYNNVYGYRGSIRVYSCVIEIYRHVRDMEKIAIVRLHYGTSDIINF